MKLVSKLAVLIAILAFVSSCQKEKLPVPHSPAVTQENAANQRSGSMNSADTTSSAMPVSIGNQNSNPAEIVGGGDADRDGGGIVGGGDDDHDGGGERKGKPH